MKEFTAIFYRTILINRRNPLVFRGRIAGATMLGLVAGFVWF